MDYNYPYLAKCHRLYLVLSLMIYTCGDETNIIYYLYSASGLFNFNTNGAYFLWKKKDERDCDYVLEMMRACT